MKITHQMAVAYLRVRIRLLSIYSPSRTAKFALKLFSTPLRPQKKTLHPFFTEARHTISFNNFTIKGFIWNPAASKTVLILHGFHSTVTNFQHFVKPLIEKDYRVIAFDAPAHGESSGRELNALLYRDFIRQLIVEFGPINSFIAHSFGGFCLSMALENFDQSTKKKIVLIAPMTETVTAINQFISLLKIGPGKVRQLFIEELRSLGGHGPEWFSIARMAPGLPETLWLHDEDDEITPYADVIPIIEKNYQHIRFVITKGMGHRRIYRDANLGKTIVDFL